MITLRSVFTSIMCFVIPAEHDVLRHKMAQEATEEIQRQALLEQQRDEEDKARQKELVSQQELAKGEHLFISPQFIIVDLK